ncbi:hypothetical protein SISSUDRAFT_1065238 [Sistotremastrum suecicum HHB10207 ss-3]|uniref:Uncharacterized protein n=1 Tax=Sistotremastrum suecicum HHB10207 ss-3 TaxID=1314776 RepID=A0A165ZR83_9AGAM|nr:hypothetical protein SISSUDRAFT_1065238 [Sistotremastrum suecicum HHB10207 ss-3]
MAGPPAEQDPNFLNREGIEHVAAATILVQLVTQNLQPAAQAHHVFGKTPLKDYMVRNSRNEWTVTIQTLWQCLLDWVNDKDHGKVVHPDILRALKGSEAFVGPHASWAKAEISLATSRGLEHEFEHFYNCYRVFGPPGVGSLAPSYQMTNPEYNWDYTVVAARAFDSHDDGAFQRVHTNSMLSSINITPQTLFIIRLYLVGTESAEGPLAPLPSPDHYGQFMPPPTYPHFTSMPQQMFNPSMYPAFPGVNSMHTYAGPNYAQHPDPSMSQWQMGMPYAMPHQLQPQPQPQPQPRPPLPPSMLPSNYSSQGLSSVGFNAHAPLQQVSGPPLPQINTPLPHVNPPPLPQQAIQDVDSVGNTALVQLPESEAQALGLEQDAADQRLQDFLSVHSQDFQEYTSRFSSTTGFGDDEYYAEDESMPQLAFATPNNLSPAFPPLSDNPDAGIPPEEPIGLHELTKTQLKLVMEHLPFLRSARAKRASPGVAEIDWEALATLHEGKIPADRVGCVRFLIDISHIPEAEQAGAIANTADPDQFMLSAISFQYLVKVLQRIGFLPEGSIERFKKDGKVHEFRKQFHPWAEHLGRHNGRRLSFRVCYKYFDWRWSQYWLFYRIQRWVREVVVTPFEENDAVKGEGHKRRLRSFYCAIHILWGPHGLLLPPVTPSHVFPTASAISALNLPPHVIRLLVTMVDRAKKIKPESLRATERSLRTGLHKYLHLPKEPYPDQSTRGKAAITVPEPIVTTTATENEHEEGGHLNEGSSLAM